MLQGLGSTLRRIFPRSDRARALAEIARSAGEMAVLTRELLRSSMEGARQSTDQRTCILDVVAMEERVRCLAEKSGASSRETVERAEEVARDTERTSDSIATTTLQMQQMAQVIAASAALMQQFVLSVSEVDSMVATIGDIARQTNLLALNAAIEAANAGKKGDGFSIIAREIRLLADRTGRSTIEIGDLIETMCSTARTTEASILKGKLAVEESIKQTLGTQHAFQLLQEAMRGVASMATEVAIASDRQIASVNRIAQSVQKLDHLAVGCTHEGDASAEMSLRIVACTVRLHEELNSLNVPTARADEYEQESAREILAKIAAPQPRVDLAMNMLKSQCAAEGMPSLLHCVEAGDLALPTLRFGQKDAADANTWLDSIAEETNCLSTIFVCTGRGKPEEQFLRTATTFKRNDGSRALDTILNPKGIAVRRLLARETHRGTAYVLGKPFLTIYEPLIAADGSLIGALYVGHPLD